MLAKPLIWLKDKNRKGASYEGTVVDNADPLKLGRVRVRVPQIHGVETDAEFIQTYDLPWINQRPPAFLGNTQNSGMFLVPDVGSTVIVEYPTSETYFGYYKGGVTSTETRTTAFDEDYPNTYGFVNADHSFTINKEKHTWSFVHPSGNFIKIYQDTTMEVFQNSGNSVRFNPDGTVDMVVPNTINVQTTTINITAPTTNIVGDVNITGGVTVSNNVVASDCISSGKSGAHHLHADAQGGNTSPPL